MMKHILVVNDDGIQDKGLRKLVEAAVQFGSVWVVAPDHECSGMSQKISIMENLVLTPFDFPVPTEGAWALSGTPADCVQVALNGLLPVKPDFVFSGMNNGYNTGMNIAYSGTIGAAMEALMSGIPAIAFSKGHNGSFETAEAYLPLLMEDLMQTPLPPNEIWNVNIPGLPLEECKGVLIDRIVAPVHPFRVRFEKEDLGNSSFSLSVKGDYAPAEEAPENSDVRAVLNGYVSVGTVKCNVL